MAHKITVRMGGHAEATTKDYTDQVPTFSTEDGGGEWTASMRFAQGGASQFQFTIDDDDNDIYAAGTDQVEAHNLVTISEDASGTEYDLAIGRVARKEAGRGDLEMAAARKHDITCDDANIDLDGMDLVEEWVRPEETGTERLLALGAAFLDGDPRLTTTIVTERWEASGAGHLVKPNPDDGEATMPAETYEMGTPLRDIIDACAETEGQAWGIVIHDDDEGSHLCFEYTEEDDWDTYPSTIAISDTDADIDNSTVFAPIWDSGGAVEHDGQEVLTGMVIEYGDEQAKLVHEDTSLIERFDRWVKKWPDATTTTLAGATARAPHLLRGQSQEHLTHNVTIKLPADKAHLVRAGMSIEIKSAASRHQETLGSFVTRRVAEVKLEPCAPEVGEVLGSYYAHLQLDRPKKIARARRRARPGPRAPRPEETGGSIRLYHSNDQAGSGDSPESAAAPNLNDPATDSSAGWEYDNSGSWATYMMYPEDPGHSLGSASWDVVNTAAGDVTVRAFLIRLDEADGLLEIIQGGGTVRGQNMARSRFGVGINEGAQNNLIRTAGRIYRPGSSSFVATLWDVGDITGTLKFAAQSTPVNRTWAGSFDAYASAAGTDYLMIEYGAQHIGPTSGGTGISMRWNGTTGVDLPEDQVTTSGVSWVEFTGADGGGESTEPVGPAGSGSPGTNTGVYAPIDHVHEHGLLSEDGDHYHDAATIQYDGTDSGLTATNVQEAIDALAAGAASGEVVDHGTMGASEEFDVSEGSDHEGVLDENLTVTLTGATDGEAAWLTLQLTQDGSGGNSITWPGSVVWPGGVAPTIDTGAGAVTIVTLMTYDGGSNWFGAYPGTGASSGGGSSGHILITSEPAGTPLVFSDLLQNSEGTDLLYASE